MAYLIIVSVICFSLNGILTRYFQLKINNSERYLPLYQALFCLFASVLFWSSNPALPDSKSLVYGLIFGTGFFIAVSCSARGYTTGSMVLTSTIINMSLIIPVIYSTFALREEITLLKIIGICLFVVVFVLASYGRKGRNVQIKFRFTWLIVVLTGFLANGFCAVIQKNYRIFYPDGNNGVFMAVAYFTGSILFILLYIFIQKKCASDFSPNYSMFFKTAGISFLSGAGSFGGNFLLSYLSDKVSGAVLYPCINGGLCVTLSVFSVLLFKEKLTFLKIIAFAVGIVAIVVLNL